MHVIGTAGHVDHGKSTLIERLTGIDPDRLEEEKRRGLTIDLGFAWLTTPSGREVGIIDVPGHERFIKNMLAGAGGISVCLFVVAANEGWMPQSTEHLAILDILGIEHGVVAITKADAVDDETLDLAIVETEERLAGTSLSGNRVVPVSATTGRGVEELVVALDEVISSAPDPLDEGRPRLWIDRAFSIAGAGTVATGTLTGGGLATGQTVSIAPGGNRARIRSIQSHKETHDAIGPGNRVALNLAGIDAAAAPRGAAVVVEDQWLLSDRFDAVIEVLPKAVSGFDNEMTERGAFLLHVGTTESAARISLLDDVAVSPGEQAFARVWLNERLPLTRGDRFVLRDAGRAVTFGGGRVLDPMPPRERAGPRRRRLTLLPVLDGDDPRAALKALVEHEGQIASETAVLRAGLVDAPKDTLRLADVFVSERRLTELATRLRDVVHSWHRTKPLEKGIPREQARNALELPPGVFDALLDVVDDIVDEGAHVRLASFVVELHPEQEAERTRLLEVLETNAYTPPLKAELTAPSDLVHSMITAGDLVEVGDFFISASQANDARRLVREHIESSGPATVAEIRDLLGTTRKYAVPLCEWLDQTGATRRQGDVRVLGPRA